MDGAGSSKELNLLPLGIPTLVIAEDPQLISAARAAYADWTTEAPFAEPQVELRLEIGSPASTDVSLDIAVEGSRLLLKGRGADGGADATSCKGHAILSPERSKNPAAFVEVADTLLLFLLARHGRSPVHGSAFMIGDLAVVLAGPSGSGKSTLALAAADRRLPVLSDDMVFVQEQPSFAVWGFPRSIHVFLADAPAGDHPTRIRGGKTKAAVDMSMTALKAEQAVLVLLERGTKLDLRRIEPSGAVEALMRLEPGFDLLESESRSALSKLASTGAWRLALSADSGAAIDLLLSRFSGD